MLGMLLNSVDGRFGVYPLGCIHRNRCIHPTGVYGQSRHQANLPDTLDTLFSKKVLGVEQCWACCSTAWTAGSGYTPLGVYTGTGVYTQPVYMVSQGTTPTFQTHSLPKKFGCGALLGMLLNSVDGRFRVYPLGCIHRNRCIHPIFQTQ